MTRYIDCYGYTIKATATYGCFIYGANGAMLERVEDVREARAYCYGRMLEYGEGR